MELNMTEKDLSMSHCRNEECDLYARKNRGNIKVRTRYGVNKDRILLYCIKCGKTFTAGRTYSGSNPGQPHEVEAKNLKSDTSSIFILFSWISAAPY